MQAPSKSRKTPDLDLRRLQETQDLAIAKLIGSRIFAFHCSSTLTTVYTIWRLFSDSYLLIAWSQVLAFSFLLASIVMLQLGHVYRARRLIMLFFAISLCVPMFLSGMLHSNGMWTTPILAMVANCLYGTKGTKRWCAVTLASVIATVAGHYLGWGIQRAYKMTAQDLTGLKFTSIGAFCMVGYMVSSTQTRMMKMMQARCEQAEKERHKAEVANRAKTQFLARMSHEIRTPMNGILGITQNLLRETLRPTHRSAVSTIHRCGENLLTLLNDALDLRNIERGQNEFELAPTDICDLINEIKTLFLARAQMLNIGIVAQLPSSEYWALTDASRLRQIVSNLVGNAIKFSDHGSVQVRLHIAPLNADLDLVTIEVQDEGIGMDQTQIARLFQAFEQVHEDLASERGGTGLGLTICKSLVVGLGGEIDVQSRPGRGSTFTVKIPMQRTNAPMNVVSRDPCELELELETKGQGLHLLVVDDNSINIKVVLLALKKLGLQADTATNGKEAVSLTRTRRYDLILMDIRMPVMDGLEATRVIRSTPGPNQSIPIIALTANAYALDRERALAAGVQGYLAKPFRMEQLSEEIDKLLAQSDPVSQVKKALA